MKAANLGFEQTPRQAADKLRAKQSTIGKLVDDAMGAIEKVNPNLKGVLPKDYNRPAPRPAWAN